MIPILDIPPGPAPPVPGSGRSGAGFYIVLLSFCAAACRAVSGAAYNAYRRAERRRAAAAGEIVCRRCGCSDAAPCVDPVTGPCGWVAAGVCSGCAPDPFG